MNKTGFFFLSALLIIISIFSGLETVEPSTQLLGSVILIALLGIPHGAIDHVIFLEDNNNAKPVHFYGFYFGLMALYLVGWTTLPMLSLILFLLLSAYHFGQSQFSELSANQSYLNHILYFSWGCSLLSGLVLYNIDNLLVMSSNSTDMTYLSVIFNKDVFSILLPCSSIVTVLILVAFLWKKKVSTERFFYEIYLFIIIHVSFYLLPLIVAFTLYFVILHSFKVLSQEFNYLKSRRKDFSIKSFIKLLLPFTLISILGGSLILLSSHYEFINISKGLLVFVLISILTLPHSVVMDNFYQKFMTKSKIAV